MFQFQQCCACVDNAGDGRNAVFGEAAGSTPMTELIQSKTPKLGARSVFDANILDAQKSRPWTKLDIHLQRRQDEDFGLEVDVTDGALTAEVLEVRQGGAIARYNNTVPESLRVKEYDVIMAVNGAVANLAGIRDHLARQKVSLLIRRPTIHTVRLDRSGGAQLGLDLDHAQNSRSLFVRKVGTGLVMELNKQSPDGGVPEGSRIIAINGVMGSSDDLLSAMRQSEKLALSVARARSA